MLYRFGQLQHVFSADLSSYVHAHIMRMHAHCRCGNVFSANLACGSSRAAARCSNGAACNRRTVARTRAAVAVMGARILSRYCSQGTRFARTSICCTRSSTMASEKKGALPGRRCDNSVADCSSPFRLTKRWPTCSLGVPLRAGGFGARLGVVQSEIQPRFCVLLRSGAHHGRHGRRACRPWP